MAKKINGIQRGLLSVFFLILLMAFAIRAFAVVPPVPTNLAANVPIDTHIALSWTASPGASTYKIYRATSSGTEALLVSNVSGTTYEDTGLNPAQTYFYKITAVSSLGEESAKSSEVSALTLASVPPGLTAVAGDSQVTVSWAASPTATKYRVFRDTLGGVGGAANFTVTGTSFTDTGLINGTAYFYELSTINPSGETPSGSSPATAIPTASAAHAPSLKPVVTATAGNAKNVLTWLPVNNATSYQILRGTSSTQVTTSLASVTSLTYTDGSLTNGTTYYYAVKAINTTGQVASDVVSAAPYVPSAPVLTATGGKGMIVITWPASSTTSYAVYRGIVSGAETLLDQGLSGNTFTDAGMSKGGTYYYKVALSNNGGTGPLSAEVSATATATAPVPSTGTVSFGLTGEPVQSAPFYLPDPSRPILGAMIINFLPNPTPIFPPQLQAIAQKYNLLMLSLGSYNFGTPSNPINTNTPSDPPHQVQILDWRWPHLSGQRLQAVLTQAAAQLSHAEIANTGVVLYGFSEGVDNMNLAVSPTYNAKTAAVAPSGFENRVLAGLHESELDEALPNPLIMIDNVPRIFLSSGLDDEFSSLNRNLDDFNFTAMTYDGLARGEATNQGAPLTVVVNVGAGHGGNEDHPFFSLWLDSVLSQRLPAILPTSAPVNLPSWQNTSSWVGTYTVATTNTAPWGSSGNTGIRMTSPLISTRSTYTDSRPFTWLPSQNIANSWLAYATSGTLTALQPVITSPATASAMVGAAFNYQITASNNPTSFNATSLPSGLAVNTTTGAITGIPLVAGTSSIQLSATNAQGTVSKTLTLTTSSAITSITFSAWETLMGITGTPLASFQNDGVSNLMKFVCNINPKIPLTSATRALLPTLGMNTTTTPGTTYLTLTYRQYSAATGVTIQPQSSPDLVTWTPVSTPGHPVAPDLIHQIGTDSVTHDPIMEVGFKVINSNPKFIRLNITQP